MDVLTTSLEALLQRATNPSNETEDIAAIEAFYALINKESEGVHIGIRLLAARLHSHREKEALQTLNILDTCMRKCGSSFHSEIGKFRFLNEMIKLVSPKYLGLQTPHSVRQAVLELMYKWTVEYSRETKIKEAYEMLKKQGVIKEDIGRKINTEPSFECKTSKAAEKNPASIFQDEEKSKLLQKLLQSKNPEDLQAANRLIKTMVKEDDKRAELKSRRITELEAVHNNVRLLNEMLDSYRRGISSSDELDLIHELHQSCERLRPNIHRLTADMQQNEEMLSQVLQASDELNKIFEKYTAVIVQGQQSLLDLEMTSMDPSEVSNQSAVPQHQRSLGESNVDVLCDIFSNPTLSQIPPNISLTSSQILEAKTTCLGVKESTSKRNEEVGSAGNENKEATKKASALQELDFLSENLLNQYLPSSSRRETTQFNKLPDKIPMNLLSKGSNVTKTTFPAPNEKLLDSTAINLSVHSLNLNASNTSQTNDILMQPDDLLVVESHNSIEQVNGSAPLDDCLVDLSSSVEIAANKAEEQQPKASVPIGCSQEPLKVARPSPTTLSLADVSVKLENVRPSHIPPLPVLEEKNGISVILHFAKDKPREDVTVIVVTTLSKNEAQLTNYLFQAVVVPKSCKVKLETPSRTELPPHNPFLPPSAISQIMLISNPTNVTEVSLKFILSFVIDGGETMTEMGEVERLPPFLHL